MLCAEHGAVGERRFLTSWRELQNGISAGLIVAILTTIKNKHVDESTPLDLTVDGEVFINGRGKSNRHMFPPNLVCRSATFCKPSGVNRILWIEIGVVVFDLMVIPCNDPGTNSMSGLQKRITFVQCVPISVRVDVRDFFAVMETNRIVAESSDTAFVDVVAEKNNEIGGLLHHVVIRGVEASGVVLARCGRNTY